ncbi:molybdate ABC transporter substrate-binding protein [Vibrio rumoiensis]|uniref:Molybdate ABC transporter substrate-binding protein n=1 Tax=Vibrio rumoiensis 1S-45 TaxID=1188252 RepID=A0A1E5E021_9VIBR|nr:molybdate ABC transporter substrate-binding protein [Vibrio rumoiensis]OEF23209.1 molybdate ABC transporter substrate-binding protein [Vibrio rumoiensis 1S-45]
MKYFNKLALIMMIGVSSSNAISADTIHVYAASSMTNVLDELGAAFKKQTGDEVVSVYAGSSTLARQIEQGAPADVFISANPKWMDYLQNQGITTKDQVINLVGNNLVLIGSGNENNAQVNAGTFEELPQLLGEQRLAIGETSSVPAGMYAKESLENMGLWKVLQHKTAPSNNVRLTLSLVERGEAPFGIVYKTDALMSQKVTIVQTFPESTHSPIIYPATTLNDKEASKAFFEFLTSQEASQTFIKYGFTPLVAQ